MSTKEHVSRVRLLYKAILRYPSSLNFMVVWKALVSWKNHRGLLPLEKNIDPSIYNYSSYMYLDNFFF